MNQCHDTVQRAYIEPGMEQDAIQIILNEENKRYAAQCASESISSEDITIAWAHIFLADTKWRDRVDRVYGYYHGVICSACPATGKFPPPQPHWWITIDDKIFDPSAGQFEDYPAMTGVEYKRDGTDNAGMKPSYLYKCRRCGALLPESEIYTPPEDIVEGKTNDPVRDTANQVFEKAMDGSALDLFDIHYCADDQIGWCDLVGFGAIDPPQGVTKQTSGAMVHALAECITHPETNWTDDPEETKQGLILAADLRKRAAKIRSCLFRQREK